jgi:hypothetical protein
MTTEGTTLSATEVTAHALGADKPGVLLDELHAATLTVPTANVTPTVAQRTQRRVLREGVDSVKLAPIPGRSIRSGHSEGHLVGQVATLGREFTSLNGLGGRDSSRDGWRPTYDDL